MHVGQRAALSTDAARVHCEWMHVERARAAARPCGRRLGGRRRDAADAGARRRAGKRADRRRCLRRSAAGAACCDRAHLVHYAHKIVLSGALLALENRNLLAEFARRRHCESCSACRRRYEAARLLLGARRANKLLLSLCLRAAVAVGWYAADNDENSLDAAGEAT